MPPVSKKPQCSEEMCFISAASLDKDVNGRGENERKISTVETPTPSIDKYTSEPKKELKLPPTVKFDLGSLIKMFFPAHSNGSVRTSERTEFLSDYRNVLQDPKK